MIRLSTSGSETPTPGSKDPVKPETVQRIDNGSTPEPTEPRAAMGEPSTVQTEPPPEEASPGHEEPSSLDRAEELANRIGSQVGDLASRMSRGVMRATARAREALADFWAEAQSIRRSKRSNPPPSDSE